MQTLRKGERLLGLAPGCHDVSSCQRDLNKTQHDLSFVDLDICFVKHAHSAVDVRLRRQYVTAPQEQHAEVVLRPGQGEAVVESLVDRQRLLCEASGLFELSEFLVSKAQAAVHERQLLQVLDHVGSLDRLLVAVDRGLPVVDRDQRMAEHPEQA